MNGKFVLLLVGLTSLVAAQYPSTITPKKTRANVNVDGIAYIDDNSVLRNRSAALAHCLEQGGELAKMQNFKLFKLLRANLVAGSYWIDGIDKQTPERFIANTNCTTAELSFEGIPDANLDFKAVNCLVLVKGSTLATSKIQAVSCSNHYKGVICGLPECTVTPAPPTGSKEEV